MRSLVSAILRKLPYLFTLTVIVSGTANAHAYTEGTTIVPAGLTLNWTVTQSSGTCGEYGVPYTEWTFSSFQLVYGGTTYPLSAGAVYFNSPGTLQGCPPSGPQPSVLSISGGLPPSLAGTVISFTPESGGAGSATGCLPYNPAPPSIPASTVISANPPPPPSWIAIMNQVGSSSLGSFDYWQYGSNSFPIEAITNTDLAGIQPTANTLSLPVGCLTGIGHTPIAYTETNQGTGITGLGFVGSFNSPYPLNDLAGNMLEALFFNDTQNYNGGREYGFFLATYESNPQQAATFADAIYVYWGTNENILATVVQAQQPLPNVYPDTEYYYYIYPIGNQNSCSFQVTVQNTSRQTVYSQLIPVDTDNYIAQTGSTLAPGTTITEEDSGFCGAVTSASGETGYVSANIQPDGALTGMIPTSGLDLNLQSVFVGNN
ncbi:MAG: hypothetical protein ABSF28_21230 [Terracidiphilus sp.]